MLQSVTNPYPGEAASAAQLLMLADEYRTAAHTLLGQGRPRKPLSRASCRLAAIHAIELYFNALLRHNDVKHKQVRGLQHSLGERSNRAQENGLHLRKRTAAHLEAMTDNREYLIARHGPDMTASMSEINRLIATLEEVGRKVTSILGGSSAD